MVTTATPTVAPLIQINSLVRKRVTAKAVKTYRDRVPDAVAPVMPKLTTSEAIKQWLDENIHKMDAPYAYIGDEPNTWLKDWKDHDFRACIVGGMSYNSSEGNLAVPLIYSQLNHTRPQYITERAFFPNTRKEWKMYRDSGVPIFSLENKKPFRDFDVIGFSISYIMPYLHIAPMLHYSGIPIWALDRKQDDPIIIVGGCMSFVAEILGGGRGGVYDLAFIGESEDGFEELLDDIREQRAKGVPRRDMLLDLQKRYGDRGIYVPQFYDVEYDEASKEIVGRIKLVEGIPDKIRKAYVRNMDEGFILTDPFISYAGGMAMGHLEIARGCSSACNFCFAEDSKVDTVRGLIHIKDVVVGDKVWDGYQWSSVTDTMVTGRQKVLRWKLQNGRSIAMTPEHHVPVFENGVLVKKHVRDFKIGDTVLLDIHDKLADLASVPTEEQLERAELLGYMIGDGNYRVPRTYSHHKSKWKTYKNYVGDETIEVTHEVTRLYFHESEPELESRYTHLLEKHNIPFTKERRVRGVYSLNMCKQQGNELLQYLGLERLSDKRDARLPEWVFSASRGEVVSLLQGLWDSDGTVGIDGRDMSFRTVSTDLADQVASLLLRMGFEVNVNIDSDGLRVFVRTKEDRVRFAEIIRLRSTQKRERLATLVMEPWDPRYQGPAPSRLTGLDTLFAAYVKDVSLPGVVKKALESALVRKAGVPVHLYREMAKYVNVDRVISTAYANFRSVEIESITEEESDTYDLTVQDSHRLNVNSLLVMQCQEGFNYRPYRERSAEVVVPKMKELMQNVGSTDVVPASFTSSDHHEINKIIAELLEKVTDQVNIISQRADAFGLDPNFAWLTGMGGSKTVSVGQEGISQRMRDVMTKAINEENLLKTAEFALKAGYKSIKYFMITNVPGTTDADYEELLTYLDKLAILKEKYNPRAEIKLSFTPLFISAFTPFQWHAATIDERSLTPWIPRIKQKGMGFRLGSGARHDESYLSQMFHLGDRRITDIMVKSAIEHEFYHFGATPKGTADKWTEMMAEKGISFDYYFQEKHKDWVFGWDYVDNLTEKDALWSEYMRSRQGMGHLEPCINECYQCGACGTETWRQRKGWAKKKKDDAKSIDPTQVKIIRQKGLVQRARLRVAVKPTHRYVAKDHWRLQFRRASYKTDVPLDKKTISFASDSIKMLNWISGVDYVDLKLTEHVFDAGLFTSDKFNKWFTGVTVTDAHIYNDMKGLSTVRDTCVYELPVTNKTRNEMEASIKTFMAYTELSKEVTKTIPNDKPGRDGKVPREVKRDFLKKYPQCARIKRMGFKGIERVIVDFRCLVDDIWVVEDGKKNLFLRMKARGEVTPYDIFQLIMKSKWKDGTSAPASRLEYLIEGDDDQDDFMTARCSDCDGAIEKNIFGEPLHGDLCLKHQDYEEIHKYNLQASQQANQQVDQLAETG